MRWTMFAVIGAVLLIAQVGAAPWIEIRGVRPDWLLAGVVFFALHVRGTDAVIGSWIIGFCGDLMTVERIGLVSLSYAAAAMGVLSVREYLFRHRALTQFAVTMAVCILVQTGWMVYRRIAHGGARTLGEEWFGAVLCTSAYTGLWAPAIHHVLGRFSRLIGISPPRYSHAGLRREPADV